MGEEGSVAGLEMCAETGGLVMMFETLEDRVWRRRAEVSEAKLLLLLRFCHDRFRDGVSVVPAPAGRPSLDLGTRKEEEFESGGVG